MLRKPLQTAYVLVFVFLFLALKDLPAFASINRMLITAILGGTGALIGAGLFKLVEEKTQAVKIIFLIAGIAATAAVFYFVNKNSTKAQSDAAMRWADSVVNARNPEQK